VRFSNSQELSCEAVLALRRLFDLGCCVMVLHRHEDVDPEQLAAAVAAPETKIDILEAQALAAGDGEVSTGSGLGPSLAPFVAPELSGEHVNWHDRESPPRTPVSDLKRQPRARLSLHSGRGVDARGVHQQQVTNCPPWAQFCNSCDRCRTFFTASITKWYQEGTRRVRCFLG
jgi:hypothetical protein